MIEIVFGETKLQIVRGDLSETKVDALVRETDASLAEELSPGGLLDAAGGEARQAVEAARQTLGEAGLPVNQVILTDAGELAAKAIIHTRLPPWKNRYYGEKIDLERSYEHALVAAIDAGFKTIAFPPLGLGARGFPGYEATVIALNTIERVVTLKDRRTDYRRAISRVEIVVDEDADFELYQRVHRAYAHRWDHNRAAS